MAGLIQIFVEGDGDVKFIADYILHIFPNSKRDNENKKRANISIDGTPVFEIQGLSGWTDIENVKTDISRNIDNSGVSLIIFDADTKDNAGGFDNRKKAIQDKISGLDCKIFLFPNNKDDGALEDLLENIINPVNAPIFECWDKFETCLLHNASPKVGTKLTIPAKKSKIYLYLEALLGKSKKEKEKIKDPNRDFENKNHWNLDAEYLNPLKDFITNMYKFFLLSNKQR